MSDSSIFNVAPQSLKLKAVLARGGNGATLYEASSALCTSFMNSASAATDAPAIFKLFTATCNIKLLSVPDDHRTGSRAALSNNTWMVRWPCCRSTSDTCQRACCIFGCCKLDGSPCIVLTLYSSSAADRLISLQGAMGLPELTSMAVEVLEGLTQLHAVRLLHLDLKPANILLDEYRHAYLGDFGISHALQTLQSCTALTGWAGTAYYMAPEQTDEEGFGRRGSYADVWGFAATVLHLVTPMQIVGAMTKRPPPAVPDTLPTWLHNILRQCLSFDAAARPSVLQLLQVLQAFQEQVQQQKEIAHLAGVQVPDMHSSLVLHSQAAHASSSSIVNFQSDRDAIIAAGAVPALVALLKSDQPSVLKNAAVAIRNLTRGTAEQDLISAAGAMPLLAALLKSEQPAVQATAAGASGNLATGSQQKADAIMAAGALPALVALLKSDQPAVQEKAAATLWVLANRSQQNQDAIIGAGAVPLLVVLLKSDWPAVQRHAIKILCNLADGPQQNADAIIGAGAAPLLVGLLRSEQPTISQEAANALCSLAWMQNQNAIIGAGALPLLVALLKSDQPAAQGAAARAFCSLAQNNQQSKDAIIGAGALPLLVALLQSDQPDVQQEAAIILQMAISRTLLQQVLYHRLLFC